MGHKKDTVVRWPAKAPTHGMHNHRWTCSIARFTGTMKGPMVLADKTIPPTGKSFEVDFCTVARWHDGQIVEENLFYDVVGMMKQIGVG